MNETFIWFFVLWVCICHSRGVANFLLAQLPMNDWSESVSSQKGLTRQVGTCCALQPSTFLRLFYYKMKTKNPSFLSRVSMMGRNDKGEPSWKKQGSSLNNITHPRASIISGRGFLTPISKELFCPILYWIVTISISKTLIYLKADLNSYFDLALCTCFGEIGVTFFVS